MRKAGKQEDSEVPSPSPNRKNTFDVVFSDQWTRADLPQPIRALSWRGALAPHVVVVTLLPLLLALTLPMDALDRWLWLRRWVDLLLTCVPQVGKTAAQTAFPQVALSVYFSVVVGYLIVLLHFLVTALFINYRVSLLRYRALRHIKPGKMLLGVLLGPLASLAGLYGYLLLPGGDPGFAEGLTTHSRFGLGLMSAIVVWVFAFIAGGAPGSVRLLIDVYLRRVGDE